MRKAAGFLEKTGKDGNTEQTGVHKKMQMPLSEIRTEFIRAKDKREQIKILSERNLCSREEIIEVLTGQGIPKEDIPEMRGRRKTPMKDRPEEGKKAEAPKAVREAVAL